MIDLLLNHGYLLLLIFMITNGFVSFPPSELVLAAAGAIAIATGKGLFFTGLIAVLGNMIGASILYFIGRYLKKRTVIFFIDLIAIKILHMKNHDSSSFLNNFSRVIKNESMFILLYMRCLPVVRSIVSLPAGYVGVNLSKFISLSLIGMSIWACAWILVGAYLFDFYQESRGVISILLLTILAISMFFLHKKAKKIIKSYEQAM